MITTEIASAAISIAEEFDRRGLRIIATPGMLIAALNAMSTIAFVPSASTMQSPAELNRDYDPIPDVIQAESSYASADDSERSTHDIELDAMISELAPIVSTHLDYAKNVVRPLVKEYAEKVSAALAAYPESASFNPTIVRVDLPEPMLNPAIAESIAEYRENTYVPLNTHMRLPQRSGLEIIEGLKTGSKNADADIDVWSGKLGADFFLTVYNEVFADSGSTVSFDTQAADGLTGADYACAVYLIAKRMLDMPPEGSPYTLVEYRKLMGELIEQSAIRLTHALERREIDLKTQLLIKRFDKNTVWVFAPVYEEWLTAGGNNAVLFGNILNDRPQLFVPGMAVDAGDHLRLWERQNLMLTTTLANKRFTEAKATLNYQAENLIATNMHAIFSVVAKQVALSFHTPEVATAVTNVADYVETLQVEDIKDVWRLATDIVAGKIFYYTDALKILMGIERACKDNPGIDIQEAALLSELQYVTDYVCDQLCVTEL